MQICHKSVKTVTGTLCSGTVVPYHRNTQHAIYTYFTTHCKYRDVTDNLKVQF